MVAGIGQVVENQFHAELNLAVSSTLSVDEGHNIATHVRHELLHHLRYLSNASGEIQRHIEENEHDGLPAHSH
jgi:divalent metal cation (Fe/Co/Zn/Cd) transporter